MSTPIIQNLIPSLRETVFKHLKSYLGGEGELSSIMESLEFWYDRLRDKEHPDLPMWQDLPSNEQDQLFDAWIDAFSLGVLERAMEREEKQITVSQFLGVKLPNGPKWSVLEDERLTKSDPVTSPLPVSVAPAASSVVPDPLVPEVVKAAQDGSVCEVEPLGEVQPSLEEVVEMAKKELCKVGTQDRFISGFVLGWLRKSESSPPSSEDKELLDWLEEQNIFGASRSAVSERWSFTTIQQDEEPFVSGCPNIRSAIRTAIAKASTTTQKGGQGV